MPLSSVALWIRFVVTPALAVGVLTVMEMAKLASIDFQKWKIALLTKISVSLVAYGLGSVSTYLLSDEFLYLKFATISNVGENYSITFTGLDRQKFDLAKASIFAFFVVGVVVWIANLYLPERFDVLPFPRLANWFWATGTSYCFLAGFLYVYIRTGRVQLGPEREEV